MSAMKLLMRLKKAILESKKEYLKAKKEFEAEPTETKMEYFISAIQKYQREVYTVSMIEEKINSSISYDDNSVDSTPS